MSTVRILILLLTAAAWIGCASGGGSASAKNDTQAQSGAAKSALPAGYSEPPAGSAMAKIQVGWSENQVREILGSPDDANAYMTGKQFNPFYFGGDTSRSDWMYKGKGRVVFSRNRWSGALKVIRVMYNPKELM